MIERFKYYADRYRVMTEVKIEHVAQLLSRVVKSDGRIGGLQSHSGEVVDVVIYEKEINNA